MATNDDDGGGGGVENRGVPGGLPEPAPAPAPARRHADLRQDPDGQDDHSRGRGLGQHRECQG